MSHFIHNPAGRAIREEPAASITPRSVYVARRQFMRAGLACAAGVSAFGAGAATDWASAKSERDEPVTPSELAFQYNNFYEFGTGKDDPAKNAHRLTTAPWQVTVSGAAERTGTFELDDLLAGCAVVERIYRLRCVEAWSMVIPWRGVALGELLGKLKPTADARYVRFKTLYRPKEMVGQKALFSTIDWPYVEGLRLDEARHPLTLLATGMYDEDLPKQNGAPLRLVVPWKYGFKSIKSIVAIEFLREQPKTTWELQNAREYGFYANVNPAVSHPRWSQATERRLTGGLFSRNRIDTLPFNGYAGQVASLYEGMDLRRHF